MSTPNPKQAVYALLVGIDKYLPPVPALDGCVNDMRAVRDFLVKRTAEKGIPLNMEILENDAATRLNVVSKFENHLTKATENDIAFFYYSGHGSQEHAHEIFWTIEEDRKNETIVCFDSRLHDGMDLADKELATLLDLVAQKNPHIVVVMDCCNSGSGTRGESKTRNVKDIPIRTRSLDSYILPRKMNSDRSAFSTSGQEQLVIPEPRHVAMSAAHSFQLAKETYLGGSPRGVFTFSFLEVLEKAVGPLSYSDVMRRVQGLVTQRTYDQVPQLFSAMENDVDLVFLDGTLTRKTNYFNLTHEQENGWVIDAGAVHGIVKGSFGGGMTELAVFAQDATEEELMDMEMALGTISVKDVLPDKSIVRLDGNIWLDTNTAYRARITRMPIEPMRICIRGEVEHGVNMAKVALGQDDENLYLKLVDSSAEADYNLIANKKEEFVITRKSDGDDQPLVEQIKGFTPNNARKAIDNLIHIAKWERLYELANPGSNIFSEAVRIELYPPNDNRPILPASDGITFRYRKSDGKEGIPQFRIKIVNTSGQRLFCSLLYLSSTFEVSAGLLPQGGLWLDAMAEAWALNGKPIRASVADEVYAYGKNQVTENLKLIVATKDFDAKLMRMPSLGNPLPQTRGTKEKTSTRSLMFDEGGDTSGDDWNATELAITIIRED